MVDEMIKEVNDLQDDFLSKRQSLSEEDLRQVKNYLTGISLAVDRMAAEKEQVYKLINNIRDIIKSHDENKNS
jgi:hypothetical protein